MWLGCVPVCARTATATVTIVPGPRRSRGAGRPGRAAITVIRTVHVAAARSGRVCVAGRPTRCITSGHVVVAHTGCSSRTGRVSRSRCPGRIRVISIHVVCVSGISRVPSTGCPKEADGSQGQES